MKTFALIALMGIGTAAHAVMIDDFVDGNVNDSISSGSNITEQAATVPGGLRTVYHEIEANPLNLSHSTVVINGIFASDNKTQVDSFTELVYGVSNSGLTFVDLNLDLSGQDRFRFNILSNDLNANIRAWVRTSSDGNWINSSWVPVLPNMVLMNQTVEVLFSDFGAFDFSDVDQIAFDLDSTASGDTVIDSFEAVPEPASMIALGLGVAALVSRKRKA